MAVFSAHDLQVTRANVTSPAPRVDAITRRKAKFWDRSARRYAASTIADLPGYEQTLARTINLLSETDHVLEIGCGTGSTALRIAAYCASYRATDVSSRMIAIANEKLNASPVASLQFAVADAEACAAEPGVLYDCVLAFNVLHLVDDLDDAIAACATALKPGGLLISKTPCLNEMNWLIPHVAVPLARLVGKAPPVLNLSEGTLIAAMRRRGLVVRCVERHASRGVDARPFIVAHKPRGIVGNHLA
ncbi:MAG: class I SAM-dependent methyltransferase [Burkholderiales bacterium]|nr:class I SAM-dependent methyltransferase [Burkholderiales bacterium]